MPGGNKKVQIKLEVDTKGGIIHLKDFEFALDEALDKLEKAPSRARAASRNLSDLDRTIGGMAGGLRGLGSVMGMAGLAGAFTALASGVSQAYDKFREYQYELKKAQAVSGASTRDMQMLAEAVDQVAADLGYLGVEGAQALYYLGSSGQTASQQMKSLPAVLTLARAEGKNLDFVASLLTKTLSQFGLQANQSGRVVNVLSAATANSQAQLELLEASLRQAGATASKAGLNLESTVSVLMALYDAGKTGEMAGTALRNTLLSLAAPSKDAAELLHQLGVQTHDANGKLRPLTDILRDLRGANIGLAEATRLVGRENADALLSMIQMVDRIKEYKRKITDTNTANKRAKETMDSAEGASKKLDAAWDKLSRTLGKRLTPGINSAKSALADFVGWMANALKVPAPEVKVANRVEHIRQNISYIQKIAGASQRGRDEILALRLELAKLEGQLSGGVWDRMDQSTAGQDEIGKTLERRKQLLKEAMQLSAEAAKSDQMRATHRRELQEAELRGAKQLADANRKAAREKARLLKEHEKNVRETTRANIAAIEDEQERERQITLSWIKWDQEHEEKRLRERADLTDRIKRLTLSERDYKIWALNQEYEKAKETTQNRELLDQWYYAKLRELNKSSLDKFLDSFTTTDQLILQGARDTVSKISDVWYTWLDEGELDFDSFADAVLDTWKRMLAQMLAQWTASGIANLLKWALGGFGGGGGGGGLPDWVKSFGHVGGAASGNGGIISKIAGALGLGGAGAGISLGGGATVGLGTGAAGSLTIALGGGGGAAGAGAAGAGAAGAGIAASTIATAGLTAGIGMVALSPLLMEAMKSGHTKESARAYMQADLEYMQRAIAAGKELTATFAAEASEFEKLASRAEYTDEEMAALEATLGDAGHALIDASAATDEMRVQLERMAQAYQEAAEEGGDQAAAAQRLVSYYDGLRRALKDATGGVAELGRESDALVDRFLHGELSSEEFAQQMQAHLLDAMRRARDEGALLTDQMEELAQAIRAIPTERTTTVVTRYEMHGAPTYSGTAEVHHHGGWAGQGGPRRYHDGGWALGMDEIPAILQRGEPVIPRRAVNAETRPVIQHIMDTGRVPLVPVPAAQGVQVVVHVHGDVIGEGGILRRIEEAASLGARRTLEEMRRHTDLGGGYTPSPRVLV